MKSKVVTVVILMAMLMLPATSFAVEAPALPNNLFDVKLGGVYKIGKGKHPYDVGSLPVTKFTAIQRYMGSGLHYFFEPLKAHKDFNYIERRHYVSDKYYETSFRLYLLPAIRGTATLTDLENIDWSWAVMLIEWSSIADRKEDAYSWAMDMCRSTQLDLRAAPKVTHDAQAKEYSCIFNEDDKKLEIKAIASAMIYKLSRSQLAMDSTKNAVEATFRRIRVSKLTAE